MKRTPLYETHKKLKAKLVEFGGWEMPVYYTSIMDEHLAVRKAASSVSAKRAALGHRGTKVTVSCYAIGQPVSGDDVWYRIIAPHSGMVSGFYLATGRDPATGISPC